MNLTPYLVFCIFVSTLGMFNFGYNTAVISAPAEHIKNFTAKVHRERHDVELAEEYVTLIFAVGVAIFAIGGMIGGFMGGYVANTLGRKGGMFFNNILGILGGMFMYLMPFLKSYELFFIGRFLIGAHCGFATCLCPMYVSEIAPVKIRGALGTVNQLAVTLGLLIAQMLGLDFILGGEQSWPYLLGLTVVPSVLQVCLMALCVESPVYLLRKKHTETGATKALVHLRKSTDVAEEIAEIKSETDKVETSVKIQQLFKTKELQMPITIAIIMQCSQQLSGICGIFYYSVTLFEQAGVDVQNSKYINIGIGAIMVIMTIAIIPLMDTVGRKTLHLTGLGGMMGCTIIITVALSTSHLWDGGKYISVGFILLFVVFFAVGPGAVPWLITAELFTQGPRPAALAVATVVNWFTNFVVGMTFEYIEIGLGHYTFLPFTILLLTFFLFTLFCVPETKNKTFEEIAEYFERKAGSRQ